MVPQPGTSISWRLPESGSLFLRCAILQNGQLKNETALSQSSHLLTLSVLLRSPTVSAVKAAPPVCGWVFRALVTTFSPRTLARSRGFVRAELPGGFRLRAGAKKEPAARGIPAIGV